MRLKNWIIRNIKTCSLLENFRCRKDVWEHLAFHTRFYNKISHKDIIKWLVVLLFDEKRKQKPSTSMTACPNKPNFAKKDIITYFSVARNGQKLLGFYPETYANSLPGSLILLPRRGVEMRDPGNEVETYACNSLQHFLAVIL